MWNVFYEDAKLALHKHDIVFADDLNAFREFDLQEPTDSLNMRQSYVNRSCTLWAELKISVVRFDCRLTMGNACSELASELRLHFRTILQAKRYHSTVGMMQFYKSKVLSYAEYRTAAIYHACRYM